MRRYACGPPAHTFAVSPYLAELHVKNHCDRLSMVALGRRLSKKDVPLGPSHRLLKDWVRSQNEERQTIGGIDGGVAEACRIYYQLPADTPATQPTRGYGTHAEKNQTDPVLLLNYLKCSSHLRNMHSIDVSIKDAITAACVDDNLKEQVLEQMPETPGYTIIHDTRLKLDSIAMNSERRWFNQLFRLRPKDLISVHLFSDGPPVTGSELQGMILQLVLKDGEVRNMILPGVDLHYGSYGLLDKFVAFMWVFHLSVGSEYEVLEWVLSKVTSITTDMGTELGLTDWSDLMRAFLRYRQGVAIAELIGTVDPPSRMFARAITIAGWCHMINARKGPAQNDC